ncbi:SMC-Scp complex subunit ScpB [Novipirellula aureliae]|nr:SMC-Scp complex subunit ScpB [Novipirellula aureliae]
MKLVEVAEKLKNRIEQNDYRLYTTKESSKGEMVYNGFSAAWGRQDLQARFPRNQTKNQVSGRRLGGINLPNTNRPYGLRLRSAPAVASEFDSATALDAENLTKEQNSEEDPLEKRKRVEAVLFLAKSPLSLRKLSQMAHLADATEARTLVRQLNTTYESYGRALRVELIAGGYRMMTRPALAPWLTRLGHLPLAVRLSTPMMETLAVVAYRQNVSRAEIEAIRGVACGDLLRQLMEKDLVRIAGRSEELGRPYLYGTTKHFLHVFGLPNTDNLPTIEWQTLQEDLEESDKPQESPPTDSFSSTKESVVSTAVASVLSEAESDLLTSVDPVLANATELDSEQCNPQSIIEDEEDEIYGDNDDDDEDDFVDDDDDWDDDDDDLDDDDDDDLDDEDLEDDDLEDEDDIDEDEPSDEWEEVDDDDDWEDDDEEDDDWEDDDDAADDDEDWT